MEWLKLSDWIRSHTISFSKIIGEGLSEMQSFDFHIIWKISLWGVSGKECRNDRLVLSLKEKKCISNINPKNQKLWKNSIFPPISHIPLVIHPPGNWSLIGLILRDYIRLSSVGQPVIIRRHSGYSRKNSGKEHFQKSFSFVHPMDIKCHTGNLILKIMSDS